MDDINTGALDTANYELKKVPIKKPSLTQVGILFSLVIILFTFIGSRAQKYEFYSGTLINEFVLIALPPVLFLFLFRFEVKKVLRLNRLGILNAVLICLIMLCGLFVAGMLNGLNLLLIKYLFGKVIVVQPPMPPGSIGFVLSLAIVGLSPAICEELMFRGVVLRGFERFGAVKSILITGFLFGLMHMDFQKLFGTFLLGALIGYIVYRTNSLYGGMLAHFTNNSAAVVVSYLSYWLRDNLKSSGINGLDASSQSDQFFATFSSMPRAQLIATIIAFIFMFLFFLTAFTGLMIGFVKNTKVPCEGDMDEKSVKWGNKTLWFLPGIFIICFLYFAEGLKLKGMSLGFIEAVLRFLGLK